MTAFRYTIFYIIEREAKAIDLLRIMGARRVRDLNRVPADFAAVPRIEILLHTRTSWHHTNDFYASEGLWSLSVDPGVISGMLE